MSRSIIFVAAAVLLGAGLGCSKSTEPSDSTPPPAADPAVRSTADDHTVDPLVPLPIVSLYFAASEADLQAGSWSSQFPLASTREIIAVAHWEPRPGTHVQRIDFLTPDGGLYRSVQIPFTSDESRDSRPLQLPGVIGSVPVRYLPRDGSVGVRVTDHMPVSGTPVQTNVVAGTWSVQLFYDGDGPLATATFEVLP